MAYMPAISGNIVFKNNRTAKKTGQLVVEKLINKKSPGITQGELSGLLKSNP
jgi:hypothetical protein